MPNPPRSPYSAPSGQSRGLFLLARGLALVALCGSAACIGNALHDSPGDESSSLEPGLVGNPGLDGGGVSLRATSMRRLSNVEYVYTVRELLGTETNVAASLLPDEMEAGFDNHVDALGMSITRLQGYQAASEKLADELTASSTAMGRLAPCGGGQSTSSCVASFVASFGRRAWRRPLSGAEKDAVVKLAVADGRTSYTAQVNYATAYLLMSSHFLYKVELPGASASLQAHQLATRLAAFLWSSTPDTALLDAAADASLLQDDVYKAQVERMLRDPRSAALVENFGRQWLRLRSFEGYTADPNVFPQWNDALKRAALEQTETGLAELFAGNVTLPQFINGAQTYLNDPLAKHYGVATPGSQTKLVAVQSASRGPLLSQAAILAATSSNTKGSIVRRGKYVTDVLLCMTVPPPPDNTDTEQAASKGVTARELLAEHTNNPSCANCHSLMDPYGFVLENYDAVGGWRTTDNGKTIDPSAKLIDGTQVANIAELSAHLAATPRVPACFVQTLLRFAYGRAPSQLEGVDELTEGFVQGGQDVRQLMLAILLSPQFRQNR